MVEVCWKGWRSTFSLKYFTKKKKKEKQEADFYSKSLEETQIIDLFAFKMI